MTGSDNVRAKLARGALWLAGGRVITNLLGLVSTLILARLLLPADFGLVALATTLFGILTAMTNISLGSALVQHKAPEREHYDTVWTLNIGRGIVVGLIFAAMATAAADFFVEPRLVNIMLALSASAILQGFESPRLIVLTRNLIFWQQAMRLIGQKAATLIVSVVLAFLTQSYWAIVFGVIAGQVATVVISYLVAPYNPRFGVSRTRELLSFSMWLSFCDFINTLNWNFDNLIVSKLMGSTALGYYTVGNNMATIPTRELTAPLTDPLFPAFSRLGGSRERLAAAYQRSQALVTAAALPAGIGLALVAEPFVLLTMGEKWLPAVLVIQCLSAIFAIQTLGSLAQPLAMSVGRTPLLFRRDLLSFAYRIPLMALGAYYGGLPGILYMRILTGLLVIIFNMNIVSKVAGLGYFDQLAANVRTFAGCAVMAVAVSAVFCLLPSASTQAALLVGLAAAVVAGALAYVATVATAWLLMKRPPGVEQEVSNFILRTIAMIRQRLAKSSTRTR